jgi:hypothetical protein
VADLVYFSLSCGVCYTCFWKCFCRGGWVLAIKPGKHTCHSPTCRLVSFRILKALRNSVVEKLFPVFLTQCCLNLLSKSQSLLSSNICCGTSILWQC